MKKWILVLCLVSAVGFCQKKKKVKADEVKFEQLIGLAEQKKLGEAADGFRQFMVDFPNSGYKPRAHYNLGEMLWQNHKVLEAAEVFKQILDSDYNETEAYGGIMEQFTLYKNRSASNLAEIYLYMENYGLAEKYLVMADVDYPYQHFCGNELTADEIYKARMYGAIYLGQGKTDKAIYVMLPHLFYTGLASNSRLLTVLEKALTAKYSVDELKKMVKLAIETAEAESYGNGRIKFGGQSIVVYGNAIFDDPKLIAATKNYSDKQLIEKVLRQHPIFSKYL